MSKDPYDPLPLKGTFPEFVYTVHSYPSKFSPYFRACLYKRTCEAGLYLWVQREWLGPHFEKLSEAYEDGARKTGGLYYVRANNIDKLAMTLDDLIPEWAQSALRLGWRFAFRYSRPPTIDGLCLSLEVDGEDVANWMPFATERQVQEARLKIEELLKRAYFGQTPYATLAFGGQR